MGRAVSSDHPVITPLYLYLLDETRARDGQTIGLGRTLLLPNITYGLCLDLPIFLVSIPVNIAARESVTLVGLLLR